MPKTEAKSKGGSKRGPGRPKLPPDRPLEKRSPELRKLAKAAFAGEEDALWLDRLISKAGYTRPGNMVRQKDLTASGIIGNRARLHEWEKEGLKTQMINRVKMYDLLELLDFVLKRYMKNANESKNSAKAKEFNEMEAEYKALERKRAFDEKMDRLIDKDKARQMFTEFSSQAIGAMETAFGGLAPQLVSLTAGEIRKQLETRIDWLCQQLYSGRVPVQKELAEKVKALIRSSRG